MEQIKNYETINLTSNEVVTRECVNTSERVYAEVSIMNVGDADVLINNTGDFADGKYITLPSGTAINGKKFLSNLTLYFKSENDGKVVVSID